MTQSKWEGPTTSIEAARRRIAVLDLSQNVSLTTLHKLADIIEAYASFVLYEEPYV